MSEQNSNTQAQVQDTTAVSIFHDEDSRFIAQLKSNQAPFYTSLKTNSPEEKAKFYNLMNNPEKRVRDMIGKIIMVKDVFVEPVEMTNHETGEVTQAPRIVLIDDKGVGYQAVSVGVFSAIKKLFGVFGTPEAWAKPISLEVQQISKGLRNILTFKVMI